MIDLIQFIGLNDLSDNSQETVKSITEKHISKMKNQISNATSIKVHIKPTKKSDQTSFYTAVIQVIVPGKVHEIKKEDHDLVSLIRTSFQALENEVEHYNNSR